MPAGATAFWRARLSKIACGWMPSVASLAWLNSTKMRSGCAPYRFTLTVFGTRRSRCFRSSDTALSWAKSAPSAHTM